MTNTGRTDQGSRGHGIRRYGLALTLAIVATVGAGTVAAAGPTPAGSSHGAHAATSIHRVHFEVEFSPHHVVDTPPRQELQPGDYSIFSDRLLNRSGHVVGTQAGSGLVTKVRATGAQVYFSLAIKLSHGQIAAQGLSTTAPTKKLAIAGGTGRYTGAAGHILLVERGDGTGALTVVLRNPAPRLQTGRR